jgi:hypothetical protein
MKTRRGAFAAFMAALLVGFSAVFLGQLAYRNQPVDRRVEDDVTPPRSETRLSFIYVGGPDCWWSTRPEVMDAVRSIKQLLHRYALENDMRFTTLGVATTGDSRAGIKHLDALTDFDVVSVGAHTLNPITLDYFWNEGLAPSTPQILVLHRKITWADRGGLPGEFAGSIAQRIGRVSGASGLAAWVSSGRILPPSGNYLSGPS